MKSITELIKESIESEGSVNVEVNEKMEPCSCYIEGDDWGDDVDVYVDRVCDMLGINPGSRRGDVFVLSKALYSWAERYSEDYDGDGFTIALEVPQGSERSRYRKGLIDGLVISFTPDVGDVFVFDGDKCVYR